MRQADREGRSFRGLSPAELLRRTQNLLTFQKDSTQALAMAHIGLLAVGPKSSVMWNLPDTRDLIPRIESRESPSKYESAAIDVLLSRRPDWAQEWLERQFVPNNSRASLCWISVKRLFDSELCHKPDSEDFAQFIRQVISWPWAEWDVELVEMIWDQFRYSTGFFSMNGPLRKFPEGVPPETWITGPERIYQLVSKA